MFYSINTVTLQRSLYFSDLLELVVTSVILHAIQIQQFANHPYFFYNSIPVCSNTQENIF